MKKNQTKGKNSNQNFFLKIKSFFKKNWKKIIPIVVILLITFLIAEYSNSGLWKGGDTTPDSNVFKYTARLMSEGGMPYRDSFDHKGPVIYFINLIARFFSPNRGIWVLEVFAIFFGLYFSYFIPKKLFKTSTTTALLITLFCGALLLNIEDALNYPELFSLPLLTISLYFFLDYLLNGIINAKRLFLLGLFMGLSLMMKPNGAIFQPIMLIIILFENFKKRNIKQLFKNILWFALGAAIIIIPIIIWLIVNGAFTQFIDQVFIFNLQYSSVKSRASFGKKATSLIFFLDKPIILSSIVISLFFLKQKLPKKQKTVLWLNTTLLILSLLLCALSGALLQHYAIIMIPFIIIPSFLLLNEIQKLKKEKTMIVILLLLLSMPVIIMPYLQSFQNAVVRYSDRGKPKFEQKVYDVCKIVEENTNEDDKISVVGNWDLIYNKANRFSASKYSYQYNLFMVRPEIVDEYLNDLKNNKPKIIVIEPKRDPSETRILDFLEENHYELIYSEKNTETNEEKEKGAKVYQLGDTKN
ncbi:hypothetical protein IKE97_02910 [Candidatus Saccharibacteria bacterium]|nr:hypothetical protein [Candidatus Saccharibacteria bacterium]